MRVALSWTLTESLDEGLNEDAEQAWEKENRREMRDFWIPSVTSGTELGSKDT